MAKKNQDGSADLGMTGDASVTEVATKNPVVTEEQPQRGGSYTRNPDGTLQQTEGHGFADPESTKG